MTPRPYKLSASKKMGSLLVDAFFSGLSWLGQRHPHAKPAHHKLEVLRNIPYMADGRREHLLDVYRPLQRLPNNPAILYIHGGAFRILSKDTHWLMGLAFAKRGYTVFSINYRLAPQQPYPAAVEDCCAAYNWLVAHAAEYGADPQRIAIAGESAGGNLAVAVALTASFARPEPWAAAVFAHGIRPVAALPACGMLQVSDPHRLRRRKPKIANFVNDRLLEVTHAYLHNTDHLDAEAMQLADPLLILESDVQPVHPLPPMFAPVGTADPLLDDTRRLAKALEKRGVVCDVHYYPGELHAFHALVFRKNARLCWQDTYRFLERYVPITA